MLSRKLKRVLLILLIVCILVVFAVSGITLGYNYVLAQNERFDKLNADLEDKENNTREITEHTPGAIEIVVKSGDDAGAIADQLIEKKLIENKLVFIILSKYNGFDSGYVAGTHYLTPDLSYDEMMFFLCRPPKSVIITFPEGITYIQIKQRLRDAGLRFDEAVLDSLMNSPNNYVDYEFVTRIQMNDANDRDYILNGYLFPDTYRFDLNASEDTIIRTFLRNTNQKFSEFYARADEMNWTWDEVMTRASLIQMEASQGEDSATDMFIISSVFMNRIRENMPLGSCATANYIREKNGQPRVWAATAEDIANPDPYNSYKYTGLPPSPICMPGTVAIQAALYPDSTDYFYFLADGKGGTKFSRTQAEQDAQQAIYSSDWDENEPNNILNPTTTSNSSAETVIGEQG